LQGQLDELKDKMRDKLNGANPDWRSMYTDWRKVKDLPRSDPEWQKAARNWKPIYDLVRGDIQVKKDLQGALSDIRDTIKQLQADLASNPPSTNTGNPAGSTPGPKPGTGGASTPGTPLPPVANQVLQDVLNGLKGSKTEVTVADAQALLDAAANTKGLPPDLKAKLDEFKSKLDKHKDTLKGVKVTVGDLASYYQEASKNGGKPSVGGFIKHLALTNPDAAVDAGLSALKNWLKK